MKPSKLTFQRLEKKYLLTKEQRDAFYSYTRPYLTMDPYGPSVIGNIYFDTEDNQLITTSLKKPPYKEKLRLRSYGIPDNDSIVYLEIKKKCNGVVNKRRIALTLDQSRAYIQKRSTLPQPSQIATEIDYFMSFYHPKPKVFLAYDRVPLIGKEQSDLRLTFDERIRRRYDRLDLGYGMDGVLLLAEGMTLLEIKAQTAYPLWLTHLLTEMKIYPISFSKYGRVFMQDTLNAHSVSVVNQPHDIQVAQKETHYQKGDQRCSLVF